MNRTNLIRSLIFSSFFSAFILFQPLFAEENVFIQTQKNFISELYQNERYFDCISEVRRLLYYDNDNPNKNQYEYIINSCYYKGAQYKTTILRLNDTMDINRKNNSLPDILLLSHSYYKTGYNEQCEKLLFNTGYNDIDEHYKISLFESRAEFLLNSYNYQGVLDEIKDFNNNSLQMNKVFTIRDFNEDILKYYEMGLKSKWLSASLSAVVPGSGQLYSGRILDGLVSFAAVAGSIYGAYYFYNKNEKSLCITLGLFGSLFYFGNIYGAYNSAKYANRQRNKNFSEETLEKYNIKYDPSDYFAPGIFE